MTRPCSKCGQPTFAETCHRHKERAPLVDRIRAGVRASSAGCWEWQGYRDAAGYGRMAVGHSVADRVHRVAYREFVGSIPDGLLVCHRCDNRRCCNPAHLFLGTDGDNARDATVKGRMGKPRATHCKRGHAFEGNTYFRPDNGKPNCATCRREYRHREAVAAMSRALAG